MIQTKGEIFILREGQKVKIIKAEKSVTTGTLKTVMLLKLQLI